MMLLAICVALALEQFRPLPMDRLVRAPVAWLAAWLEQKLNDGVRLHGGIAWALGAALPAFALLILQLTIHPLLTWLLACGVLYLTMGFRQFSHFFTDIHLALRVGDLDRARRILAEWRGRPGELLSSSEVARLAIEQALPLANRHVFAPLLWFVLLGPAGALLYRLTHLLDACWRVPAQRTTDLPADAAPLDVTTAEAGEFGWFAHRAFSLLDWLPVRLTAIAFAVAGNFEDAVNCWRTQAANWPDRDNAVLLASGAGALGVRLGMPVRDAARPWEAADVRPELGVGEDADADFMQSTIGLVWRSLVGCLAVLALMEVSAWIIG